MGELYINGNKPCAIDINGAQARKIYINGILAHRGVCQPFITVSESSVTFDYESAVTSVTVSCFRDRWTASTTDNWIMFPPSTGGAGDVTFTFSATENQGDSARTGTIVFLGNRTYAVLTVNQGFFDIELEVSPESFSFDWDSSGGTMTITTNTDWTIS